MYDPGKQQKERRKLQTAPVYPGTKPIQVYLIASKVSKNSGTRKEIAYDLFPVWLPLLSEVAS